MPTRDQDPFRIADEPQVRRWPRAIRLMFVLLAAVACWAMVMAIGWLALRRWAI